MRCLVTAGPTFEPLDSVRRLTNFSTGRLGSELALHLAASGHEVRLLLGEQATWPPPQSPIQVERFTTTSDLLARFTRLSSLGFDLICHAAAVSDFQFGTVQARNADGRLVTVPGGKIPTSLGHLYVELIPTPKILMQLRGLYPAARIIGWKFEVDGDRESAVRLGRKQIADNHTNACVVNGPAYGVGFGWVEAGGNMVPLTDRSKLFGCIESGKSPG